MSNESRTSGFGYWLRVAVIGRRPKRTLIRLAVLVVGSVIVFRYVLLPVRVTGISMEPTFHNHSFNVINRLAYVFGQPQRGDVDGLRMIPNPATGIHELLLKRLVGLPGETISFRDGHVWVNDDRQDEPYLKLPSNWNIPDRTLGSNEYFFVGDNRSMSSEEHVFGVAERAQIVGRVVFKGNP